MSTLHQRAQLLMQLADANERAEKAEADLAAALAANRDCVDHFEQMKAELAALRKRIADAPIGYWSPVQDDELCATAVNEIGPCPSDRIVHLLVDDA